MKHLTLLLSLFFWGMVLKCLSEMVAAYPGFTQSAFAWTSYVLWTGSVGLVLNNMWYDWRHRRDPENETEVHREN